MLLGLDCLHMLGFGSRKGKQLETPAPLSPFELVGIDLARNAVHSGDKEVDSLDQVGLVIAVQDQNDRIIPTKRPVNEERLDEVKDRLAAGKPVMTAILGHVVEIRPVTPDELGGAGVVTTPEA